MLAQGLWADVRGMNAVALAALAFSMSMDGFAASVGGAAGLRQAHLYEAMRTGLVFGAVSTLTPLMGWVIGTSAAMWAMRFNPWIAFGVLLLIGARMAAQALKAGPSRLPVTRQCLGVLVLTGIATSLDALAVGVTLALVKVDIMTAAAAIGGATFLMAVIGTLAGRWIGPAFGRCAEVMGGICLIGVGLKILLG